MGGVSSPPVYTRLSFSIVFRRQTAPGLIHAALLIQAEFPVELLNASAGVYQLLLACIKGVTLGADFYSDILLCASRLNNLSASALYSRLLIVGMYPLFHHVHLFCYSLSLLRTKAILTQAIHKCKYFVQLKRSFDKLT